MLTKDMRYEIFMITKVSIFRANFLTISFTKNWDNCHEIIHGQIQLVEQYKYHLICLRGPLLHQKWLTKTRRWYLYSSTGYLATNDLTAIISVPNLLDFKLFFHILQVNLFSSWTCCNTMTISAMLVSNKISYAGSNKKVQHSPIATPHVKTYLNTQLEIGKNEDLKETWNKEKKNRKPNAVQGLLQTKLCTKCFWSRTSDNVNNVMCLLKKKNSDNHLYASADRLIKDNQQWYETEKNSHEEGLAKRNLTCKLYVRRQRVKDVLLAHKTFRIARELLD